MHKYLIIFSGAFYGVLCIFSIVTGIIYMSGKRELNPLELPDSFVKKLEDKDLKKRFTFDAGLLTFVVGIFQGISSYCLIFGRTKFNYYFALGFTIFSICSVLFKLKGKINIFPLLKMFVYVVILIILLLSKTRMLFV